MDLQTQKDAFIESLDEKALESFMKMTEEEQAQYIQVATLGFDIEGIELEAAKIEDANMPILRVGMAPLVAGGKIAGRLKGTRFIFSKEHKENWKKFKASNGEIYWTNSYFVFEHLTTGVEFGVWNYAGLYLLTKIPTVTVYGQSETVKENPVVEVTYLGLIEGRDKLQKDYGIELMEGNSAHVFDVKVQKGHPILRYEAGCINPLNSPTPIVRNGEKVDKEEATKNRFEKLSALNGTKAIEAQVVQ